MFWSWLGGGERVSFNGEQTELMEYAHVCALWLEGKQQHSGLAEGIKGSLANPNIKSITVAQMSHDKNMNHI